MNIIQIIQNKFIATTAYDYYVILLPTFKTVSMHRHTLTVLFRIF